MTLTLLSLSSHGRIALKLLNSLFRLQEIQTLAGFLFVLRALGRIQIHRQILNFRDQYKIGRRLLIIRPGRKSTKASVLIALFYGSLTKKEKEKSKRMEENGDRKINTLISENASSLGLPLFFHSLISLS